MGETCETQEGKQENVMKTWHQRAVRMLPGLGASGAHGTGVGVPHLSCALETPGMFLSNTDAWVLPAESPI